MSIYTLIDGTSIRRAGFLQGAVVGTVRKYSDRMLELLLKGHAPEKYKDRVQHSGDVKVNVNEQALLEARQRVSKLRN